MAMRMDAFLQRYSLSNSRFFVLFIAKNGDAEVDVGFNSVVNPIATSLTLFITKNGNAYGRLALQDGLSNSRLFVPFITKNGDAEVDVGFYSVCRIFVPFIAKNGDAEVEVGFYRCMVCPIAASLSLSFPRMAMPKWTLAFIVCGSSNSRFFGLSLPRMAMRMDAGFTKYGLSNSRFFVPFIAKNGDAYGRWLLQRCGSSNSRFFVPFIAKNGDAYDIGFTKHSLPRMAMRMDAGFYDVVCPITTSLSISLPRTAMRMDVGFYSVDHPIATFLSHSLPRMAMRMDAGFNKGMVHPIAASLSLSLPRMAMRKWTLALQGVVHPIAAFVPFIAKNGDAYVDVGFTKCVVHPIAASLSLSMPKMAMQKLTLALTVSGLSNSRFFVAFIAKNGDAEVDVGFYSVWFIQ
ncbi:hypothetical protein K7X08_002690 [Anisodus acutangulus]|uniref:Uncharacterized protein n=1 Tax=Anisodus acutangulus TaxID=402998 RepID=A0A9Q1QS57_9SOLA|nr:hypothetical protein K7X08_002690 [Anisodus acutangulus]